MNELLSYVCVRADHQWATAASGQVRRLRDGLAYCPDASLNVRESHEWRGCGPSPLAAASELVALFGQVESAAS